MRSKRSMVMADGSETPLDYDGTIKGVPCSTKAGQRDSLWSLGSIARRYAAAGWRVVLTDDEVVMMKFSDDMKVEEQLVLGRYDPGTRLYLTSKGEMLRCIDFLEKSRDDAKERSFKVTFDREASDEAHAVHRTFLHSKSIRRQAKMGRMKGLDWLVETSARNVFCKGCITASMNKRSPKLMWYKPEQRRKRRTAIKAIGDRLKRTEKRFLLRKKEAAARLGHTLCFDLSCGWTPSIDGYAYVMCVVDVATRWQWRFTLKKKTDIRAALLLVRDDLTKMSLTCRPEVRPRMVEGKAAISFIVCDGDGVHRSTSDEEYLKLSDSEKAKLDAKLAQRISGFEDFCKDRLNAVGVVLTAPHSHETAGIAEAAVKQCQIQVGAMIWDSPLKSTTWSYAARHTGTVCNYIYHSAIKMSAHEKVYGEVPDWSRLRGTLAPYGSVVSIHIPISVRGPSKPGIHGSIGFYVGKSVKHRGSIICLVNGKKRIIPITFAAIDRNVAGSLESFARVERIRGLKKQLVRDPIRDPDNFDVKATEKKIASMKAKSDVATRYKVVIDDAMERYRKHDKLTAEQKRIRDLARKNIAEVLATEGVTSNLTDAELEEAVVRIDNAQRMTKSGRRRSTRFKSLSKNVFDKKIREL